MKKVIATILALAGLAAPLAADWLVTKDGARVETDGPWEIKGAVVLFTLPNGTLSSLRLSEVDLDASAEATYEAANPPPAKGEEEKAKEPVLVLTNKDVSRARDVPGAEAGGEEGSGGGQAVVITDGFGLLDWELRPRGDGLELMGTLVNNGEESVEGLRMVVALYNTEGLRFAETSAALTVTVLRPGAGTTFRAGFPRVTDNDYRVEFEVQSRQPRP